MNSDSFKNYIVNKTPLEDKKPKPFIIVDEIKKEQSNCLIREGIHRELFVEIATLLYNFTKKKHQYIKRERSYSRLDYESYIASACPYYNSLKKVELAEHLEVLRLLRKHLNTCEYENYHIIISKIDALLHDFLFYRYEDDDEEDSHDLDGIDNPY